MFLVLNIRFDINAIIKTLIPIVNLTRFKTGIAFPKDITGFVIDFYVNLSLTFLAFIFREAIH